MRFSRSRSSSGARRAVSLLACSGGEARRHAAGRRPAADAAAQRRPSRSTVAHGRTESRCRSTIRVIGTAERRIRPSPVHAQITGELTDGQFQGRRRRHGRARCSSRWIAGRSKRRCSRRRPTSTATSRRRRTRESQAQRYQDLAERGIATTRAGRHVAERGATRSTRPSRPTAPRSRTPRSSCSTRRSPRRCTGRTGALMVHEGNLVRANDTTPLVVINQVAPIYVSFAIPEVAAAGAEALHGAAARCASQARAAQRARPPRRRARSRSSTTPSIRRPARSGSRARSRTTTAGSGRASSSTSVVTLTTDPTAIVVPTAAVQAGQQGTVRVRRQAGSDGRAAAGRRSRARAGDETVDQERAASPAKPSSPTASCGWCRQPRQRQRDESPARWRHESLRRSSSSGRSRRRCIMLGILVFGAMAYRQLPVSDLPTVDFPTIQVSAGLPGASPETMASAVALPLEKQFATIAGLTIDQLDELAGQHEHHAAVRSEPQHRRRRAGRAGDDRARGAPAAAADAGAAVVSEGRTRAISRCILLVLRSATLPLSTIDEYAQQTIAQRHLDGRRRRAGQTCSARRSTPSAIDVDPRELAAHGDRHRRGRRARSRTPTSNLPTGTIYGQTDLRRPDQRPADARRGVRRRSIIAYRNGNPVRLDEVAHVYDGVENDKSAALADGRALRS